VTTFTPHANVEVIFIKKIGWIQKWLRAVPKALWVSKPNATRQKLHDKKLGFYVLQIYVRSVTEKYYA